MSRFQSFRFRTRGSLLIFMRPCDAPNAADDSVMVTCRLAGKPRADGHGPGGWMRRVCGRLLHSLTISTFFTTKNCAAGWSSRIVGNPCASTKQGLPQRCRVDVLRGVQYEGDAASAKGRLPAEQHLRGRTVVLVGSLKVSLNEWQLTNQVSLYRQNVLPRARSHARSCEDC